MIKKLYYRYRKKQILRFVAVFNTTLFLLAFNAFGEEKLLKEESYRDWSVFVSKDDPVTCFVASQSVKSEAYKNGQKLSSVNREKGTIYVIKKKK